MRRSSLAAQTVALGIVADDIFGALMDAGSSRGDHDLPAWMIATRPAVRPTELGQRLADDQLRTAPAR
jgi:hypothetical protein